MYVCMYVRMYVYVCMCVYVYVYVYVCMCLCVFVFRVCLCLCLCMSMCLCLRACLCVCLCVCVFVPVFPMRKPFLKFRASRSHAKQVYGTLHFTCVLPMLSHLEGSRSELNFKIISRWFQTSQNAAQNGAKTSPLDDFLAHLGAKMAPRCATWRVFGSILVTFVESWARSLRKVTDCKTLVKHNEKTCFLQCCERSWRLSWLILALGWTMLGNLVANLEQLCDKMYPKLQKNAHCKNPRKTQ